MQLCTATDGFTQMYGLNVLTTHVSCIRVGSFAYKLFIATRNVCAGERFQKSVIPKALSESSFHNVWYPSVKFNWPILAAKNELNHRYTYLFIF